MKNINLKNKIAIVNVFLIIISQIVLTSNVYAAFSDSSQEFFTQRTNYCGQASNCDALLQWGIAKCVPQAASSGNFFSFSQNGGSASYNNEINKGLLKV
jgi:hypothetical protein